MRKIYFILFSAIVFLSSSFAQEFESVHARHKKEFGGGAPQKSLFDANGAGIIPLQYDKSKLSASVFGYMPYWEYQSAKNNLHYDLLTHIALFDFELYASNSQLGKYSNPSYWPWTDLINAAHSNGVQAVMCITNFNLSTAQLHTLITVDSIKNVFFNQIKNTIQQYNLDGVNIDFEALSTADRGSLINSFMTDLTNFIHTNLPGKEVSYAGPIINWSGWNLPGLANACDYIFIMGYDFYGSWSETTGPSAPLTGGTYNVTSGLTSSSFGYGGALASYANKLILGVPYYGNKWSAKTSQPYASIVKYVGSTTFRTEMPNSSVYGLLWDSQSKTPWFFYKQDTVYMQTWFDTDSSLGLKYDLAKSKNLKGVGMWALGQDGTRTEYWDLLKKRYLDVKNSGTNIPDGFSLSQNYPNPFNPSTTIKYELPKSSFVSLKVYDILGREAASLVNEEKPAGSYSVDFTAKLSSGVYFYTLKAGAFVQTKKLTIIK